ncbi:MAG: acyltransferase family protein [Methanobacteriaceae archaeon]|nr:acyltransferase family protein [Methanobacteriaceae archaeon]
MDTLEKRNRIEYIDYLKCMGIIGVLSIHLCSSYVGELSLMNSFWIQGLFLESISRFGIILFVMVSGLLLLRKKQEIKNVPRRLKRILIPFLFWFICYFFVKLIFILPNPNLDLIAIINFFISGLMDPTIISVQFWFVYMIMGLYIVSPIVSTWISNSNMKEIEYFLCIWIMFMVLNLFNEKILLLKYLSGCGGFLGYFILGYYLNNKKSKYLENRKLGFILFVIGTLITFFGVMGLSFLFNGLNLKLMPMGDLTPAACMQAVGIFIIIKNTDFSKLWGKFNERINKLVVKISILSYGIYLSNILLIRFLQLLGIYSAKISPLINVPLFIIITLFILSVMLIIMDKIPILKYFTGIK